ncbi:glycosyltransferase [Psychroserpens sp. SPM9]|uniref:glycosyltransferase n=1 Tax=Psychroserpens sp. SPM9 TaxID=2975598 RepID=UPI0021A3A98B|nr:glycosyltransferase [Psychroserpens sp. SPM9]MDG5492794.1 glycosyltransferase [Psychroserpens sp. SPM9]
MPVFEILFYIFIVIIGIQLIFHGIIFGKFATHKPPATTKKNRAVSVIICAKNEAENLKLNLPYFIDQDYESFEIVLINDSSTDDTLEVMEAFKAQHNNLKIVNVKPVEKFWGNKKYALTLGIKAASNNLLLFTDADCKPLSKHWITEMSAHFSNQTAIILGYGAYQKIKGSFLNLIIRFETFMTAVQYFSYAKIGWPYMGVGRNLAYKKELFFEANGFIDHIDKMSGDDDLFINQMATKANVAICVSKDSFTESLPKTTFKSWMLQKRRHISTAVHYKMKHKILLTVFYVSQILFWLLGSLLLAMLFQWKIVLALIILRFLIQYINLYLASKKLNETRLILFLPVLEIVLILFQFFIFIKNLSSKPHHWK